MFSVYVDGEVRGDFDDVIDAVNMSQAIWIDGGNVVVEDEYGILMWDNGDFTQEGMESL